MQLQRPHKSPAEYSQTPLAIYMRAYNLKRRDDPRYKESIRKTRKKYNDRKLQDPEFKAMHAARNNARLKERRSAPETWARWALNQIRARAKRDGLVFNLTPEDLTPPKICPALHVPIVYGGSSGEMYAPTVDRLRPSLGYVKGNVRVISRRANSIKSDGSVAEVMAVAAWMRREGL